LRGFAGFAEQMQRSGKIKTDTKKTVLGWFYRQNGQAANSTATEL
jgi:hypothetical protein